MGILFQKFQPLKGVFVKNERVYIMAINKSLGHELLEDFKKAEKTNTLGKINLWNIKTTFRLNL